MRVQALSIVLLLSPALALATLTDNFNSSHTYWEAADFTEVEVSGTIWDGMLNFDRADGVDANISQPGTLTIDTHSSGSDSTGEGSFSAPTLYLDVAGDFDVRVEIPNTALLDSSFENQGIIAYHDESNLLEVLNIHVGGSPYRRFREYTDGVRTQDVEGGFKQWLRMTRTGDAFEGYHSDDGSTWTSFGPAYTRADLPGTLKVGLFAADPSDGTAPIGDLEAAFDNFSIVLAQGLPTDPVPADGAVLASAPTALSWTNPEPDDGVSPITCTVYFGLVPDRSQMDSVTLAPGVSTVDINASHFPAYGAQPLTNNAAFRWAVDCEDASPGSSLVEGVFWSFSTDYSAYNELTVTEVSPHTVRIALTKPGETVVSDDVLVARQWPAPALRIHTTTLTSTQTVILQELTVTVSPSPLTVDIARTGGDPVQQLVIDEVSGALQFGKGHGPLFGLGSGAEQFDRGGKYYPMVCTGAFPNFPEIGHRLPIPFLVGSEGWGLFVHRPYETDFDLRGALGKCERQSGESLPLDVFVTAAEDPAILLDEYTQLTGRPAMPPRWALGYSQSHRTLAGPDNHPDEVMHVADTFRQKGLPCDGLIYLGTGYCPAGWNLGHDSFAFKPETFPQPADIIDQLHDQHFKVTLHTTYPSAKLHGNIPPAPGETVDSDHIESYWSRHQPVFELGIDGWWPDTGQGLSVAAKMARARMYYQGQLADRPGLRPFTAFENVGYSGMQRYGAWTRTGDTIAGWDTLRNQVPNLINASLSGVPYIGSCPGGFWPTKELTGEMYVRWFQFNAFTPFFQSHGRTWYTRLPWGWNTGVLGPKEASPRGAEPNLSELNNPAVEPICKQYLELRYRLLPYLYTLSRQAYDTGMPIIRAMWLHYPDDPVAVGLGDQYLWGRDLLVAPVTAKGAAQREVYLPQGAWYDFWTNEETTGGVRITRAVDLETLPLYVRAGTILPLDPVRQYTEQPVDDPATIRIYQGADGQFTLYEDDGNSQDYLEDENTVWTTFTWDDDAQQLLIAPDPRSTAEAGSREFELLLLPDGRTMPVTYEGTPASFTFAPPPPEISLSDTSLASNAPPGTLVGSLSMLSTNPASFEYALDMAQGDHTYFDIPAGTTHLRTTTFVDASTYSVTVVATNGNDGFSTNKTFTIDVTPVADDYLSFRVKAAVDTGTATGNKLVGFLQAEDAHSSGINFEITGGRDDLFRIVDSANLTQIAGSDPGPVGATNYVAVTAANDVTARTLLVAVVVEKRRSTGGIMTIR